MPNYRYRAKLNASKIESSVPGVIVVGGNAPANFVDVDAAAGSKGDLDSYMEGIDYLYESTDPDVTPEEATSVEGLGLNAITFRPGAASDKTNKATWAEIEIAIANAGGRITVFVDDRLAAAEIPATADTQCFGFVVLTALNPESGAFLTILDGGRLRNVGVIRDALIVVGAPTSVIPLYYGGIAAFQGALISGTTIGNAAGASVAMIEIDCAQFSLSTELTGDLNNVAEPLVPIVKVNSGNFFGWNCQQNADVVMSPNLIEGDNTTSLQISHDASIAAVAQALFLGSQLFTRLSKSEALQPSSGAVRPVAPLLGQMHFDTSLVTPLPIWYDGVNWTDAAGNVV